MKASGGGSAGILANLSDDTRIEFGVGYEDYDEAGKALGIGGGVYWDPVSQVTLGAGATYIDFDDAFIDDDGIRAVDDDSLEVFVGTWLRFP
jgi:opacity protein-like surface antigen